GTWRRWVRACALEGDMRFARVVGDANLHAGRCAVREGVPEGCGQRLTESEVVNRQVETRSRRMNKLSQQQSDFCRRLSALCQKGRGNRHRSRLGESTIHTRFTGFGSRDIVEERS